MSEAIEIELWNVRAPLDPVIHTPRGPVVETCLLFAFVTDDDGRRGIGYASFRRAAEMEAATNAARDLLTRRPPGLAGLLSIERTDESSGKTSAASRAAASALSLAAWDLAGKRAGVACADLWGRPAGREHLDCYASALWLDKTLDELIAEARAHRSAGYRYVKMRVSQDLEDNLARIGAVASVYAEPGTIALETGSEWDETIANTFLDRCGTHLLWVEDPAPHAALHRVQQHAFNTIAAGEKATTANELYEIQARSGLRNIIIDVQYIGGPLRFLETARTLNALGATVGGHRFSHYSTHLLASLPRSLPIELLDWTNPVFRPLAGPDATGKLNVEGAGFRIEIERGVLERYGAKVVTVA